MGQPDWSVKGLGASLDHEIPSLACARFPFPFPFPIITPPLPPHTHTQVPSKAEFKQAAEIFERTFARLCAEVKPSRGMTPEEADQLFLADVNKDGRLNDEELIAHFAAINTKMTKEQVVQHVKDIVHKFDVNDDRKLSRIELFAYDPGLRRAVIQALKAELGKAGILGLGDSEKGHVFPFIEEAVAAFFDQDLLQAVRMFLMNAKGSFGLCVNSSLDAHRQIVVAARAPARSGTSPRRWTARTRCPPTAWARS